MEVSANCLLLPLSVLSALTVTEALSAVSADSHRTCRGQFTSGQCQVAGRLDSSGTEHSTTPTRHHHTHHTHHTHHSPQSPPRSEKVSQTDRQKGKRVLTVIAIFSRWRLLSVLLTTSDYCSGPGQLVQVEHLRLKVDS